MAGACYRPQANPQGGNAGLVWKCTASERTYHFDSSPGLFLTIDGEMNLGRKYSGAIPSYDGAIVM
jgi:hypothetical protein